MSRKRNSKANQHKRTQVWEKGRLASEADQAKTDKEITGKTTGYIRVASYRPAKGDGNGKAGSKWVRV